MYQRCEGRIYWAWAIISSRWHRRYVCVPRWLFQERRLSLTLRLTFAVQRSCQLEHLVEGAQSLASPSAISTDDSEQEAAPIERGASSSVGSPYADERHVDGVVGQQFILARPLTIGHGHVPSRCLDPNVTWWKLNQTIRFCSVARTGLA